MKLHMLSIGRLQLNRGAVLTPGLDEDVWVEVPVPVYVLQLETGANVLVDTGLHPAHITRPDYLFEHLPAVASTLHAIMGEGDQLEHQLMTIGLSPDDITMVVNTHFHYDHCGNNLAFPGRPIVVQRRHYEHALSHEGYFPQHFDSGSLSYEFVDGDTELLPGLQLLVTSGHAFFHQALVLRDAATGPVILCADAICTEDNVVHDTWSGEDPGAARESGRRLVKLARETGARLVYGHDHQQWATLAAHAIVS